MQSHNKPLLLSKAWLEDKINEFDTNTTNQDSAAFNKLKVILKKYKKYTGEEANQVLSLDDIKAVDDIIKKELKPQNSKKEMDIGFKILSEMRHEIDQHKNVPITKLKLMNPHPPIKTGGVYSNSLFLAKVADINNWDLTTKSTGPLVCKYKIPSPGAYAVSADGKKMAVVADGCRVLLRDSKRIQKEKEKNNPGQKIEEYIEIVTHTKVGFQDSFSNLTFSEDGKKLYACHTDGKIIIADLKNDSVLKPIDGLINADDARTNMICTVKNASHMKDGKIVKDGNLIIARNRTDGQSNKSLVGIDNEGNIVAEFATQENFSAIVRCQNSIVALSKWQDNGKMSLHVFDIASKKEVKFIPDVVSKTSNQSQMFVTLKPGNNNDVFILYESDIYRVDLSPQKKNKNEEAQLFFSLKEKKQNLEDFSLSPSGTHIIYTINQSEQATVCKLNPNDPKANMQDSSSFEVKMGNKILVVNNKLFIRSEDGIYQAERKPTPELKDEKTVTPKI